MTPRPPILAVTTLIALAVVSWSPPVDANDSVLEVFRMNRPVTVADGATFRLEVPHGSVTMQPASVDAVELEIVAHCAGTLAPCRDDARALDLVQERDGDQVVVGITGPESYGYAGPWHARFFRPLAASGCGQRYRGTPSKLATGGWRLDLDIVVRYPRRTRVELLIGEGEAVLERLDGDVSVTVGEGHARIKAPKRLVSEVDLRAKRGGVQLTGVERTAVKGRTVQWGGEGDHRVSAEVHRGDIVVQLY